MMVEYLRLLWQIMATANIVALKLLGDGTCKALLRRERDLQGWAQQVHNHPI